MSPISPRMVVAVTSPMPGMDSRSWKSRERSSAVKRQVMISCRDSVISRQWLRVPLWKRLRQRRMEAGANTKLTAGAPTWSV